MKFAIVPQEAIFKMGSISAAAFNLYVFYCGLRHNETGICLPASQQAIAEATGLDYSYISKLRAKLLSEDWILLTDKGEVKPIMGFSSQDVSGRKISKSKKTEKVKIEAKPIKTNDKVRKISESENFLFKSENLQDGSENFPVESENLQVHDNEILDCNNTNQTTTIHTLPVEVSKSPRKRDELFESVCEGCAIDLKLMTDKQRNEANQTVGILRREGIQPDEVQGVVEWWYANDWRGKQGQAPRPSQLREIWRRASQQPRTSGGTKNEQNLRAIAERWQREDETFRGNHNQEQTGLRLICAGG